MGWGRSEGNGLHVDGREGPRQGLVSLHSSLTPWEGPLWNSLMAFLGLVLTDHAAGWLLTEPWPHIASLELMHIKGHTTS